MAFLLKAIGLSDAIPGFPFTPASNDPGHVVYTSPLMCWTVRSGTPHNDAQKKVSIFSCSVSVSSTSGSSSNNELVKQLGRNAMRRAKSLMIPGFLKCLGATEYRDTIYIATEQCLSLKEVLESRELRTQLYGATAGEYYASVAYGISTVGEALSSLHQNRLVHGNVNCQSVFVLPSSGMWRLFGLELVFPPGEMGMDSSNCVFENARRAGLLEGYRCPPEFSAGGSGDVGSGNAGASNTDAFAIDSWVMAGLLYETVGITVEEAVDGKLNTIMHSLSSEELRNTCRRTLPKSLHSGCASITVANPRMRKSVAAFLEHCEFVKNSTFVQYMKSLSEALLLDVTQQVRLVESLTEVIDTFPLRPCLCYVLPRLEDLIRAAMKSGSPNGTAGVSIGPVVAPVLKIAARTSAGEDFDLHVTPVLIQMFQCSDVLMRYKLLVGAEVYGGKLSPSALNSTIWPLYAKGFMYATPSVREYSARALVHLAPHMSETVLGDQVPKALGLLQRDQDGALRANATIALHLISSYITPPTQRAAVVLNYCRPMLRDAFEPSRVAALRSLRGSIDCLSAKQLAEGLLPAVSPLTVDPTSEESRSTALGLMKAAMEKLEENHNHLTAQYLAVPSGTCNVIATDAATTATGASGGAVAKTSSPHSTADLSHIDNSNVTNSSSWGWGIFKSSPPATPATATVAPAAAAAAATLRHGDAASSLPGAAASLTSNTDSRLRACPLLRNGSADVAAASSSSTATHSVTLLPVPVILSAVAGTSGDSSWSADDDDGSEKATNGAVARGPESSGGEAKKVTSDNDGWDDDDDGYSANDKGDAVRPATTKVKPLGLSSGGGVGAARGSTALFPGTTTTTNAPATNFTTKCLPSSSTSALHAGSHSSAFTASPLPLTSATLSASGGSSRPMVSNGNLTSSLSTAAPSGPMKLRKKGGLGAARLD